ncbi:hypothetical protein D3C71_1413980 [compost metagenome]
MAAFVEAHQALEADVPAHVVVGDPGQGEQVGAAPGDERVAAQAGVDFHPVAGAQAWAAGVEARGVRHHQGVGRYRKASRCRPAEPGQFVFVNAERALAMHLLVGACRAEALAILPGQPFRCQAMGARDVTERPLVVGHVIEKQPGLGGRMEGIGVQAGLRVLLGIHSIDHDRLQLIGDPAGIRRGIGNQVTHTAVGHKGSAGRITGQDILVQADPPGHGLALAHFPAGAAQVTQFGTQGGELFGRQCILANEKPLLLEACKLPGIQPWRQGPAAHGGHAHGQLAALHVQAQGIEPGAADYRVVLERFGVGQQLQAMPGQCRVAAQVLQ